MKMDAVTPVLGTSLLAGHHGYFPVRSQAVSNRAASGRASRLARPNCAAAGAIAQPQCANRPIPRVGPLALAMHLSAADDGQRAAGRAIAIA
jgi:hypothetical protein